MKLNFMLNGNPVEIDVDKDLMLVDVIRETIGLTGTKVNCRKGVCGVCSVIMDGKLVKSCQIPALKANNTYIMTIEGIGSPQKLHPLQKAFIDYGAVQCGYCKPAFILAAYILLEQNKQPTHEEIVNAINPILCRCTGYHQIIEAIHSVVNQIK